MDLKKTLTTFLQKHADPAKPLLLGFSGGADSRALFSLLLDTDYSFGVAHVDHGWRKESAQEAEKLKVLAESQGIPFHLKCFDPKQLSGNLEGESRLCRLQFFQELCETLGYQAVLLAHHADDQVETVCKRLFEGAPLVQLGGMKSCGQFKTLKIYRPFLKVRKKEILNYLNRNNLPYFEDRTNCDPQFLRARMRSTLLPHLSETFGKEIASSFETVGEEAREMREYLDRKVSPYLTHFHAGAFGHYLDLSGDIPEEDVELKHLIRSVFWRLKLSLPRDLVAQFACALRQNKANHHAFFSGRKIYIDRRRLFILRPGAEAFKWQVSTQHQATSAVNRVGWEHVFQGKVEVILPEGEYRIAPAELTAPYPRTNAISKWWTSKRVPAFFRPLSPVVWCEGRICFEFLSSEPMRIKSGVKISLNLIVT